MDKKDIYEHLAKIYLDASSAKKNKKTPEYPRLFKNLFFASIALVFLLAAFILYIIPAKQKSLPNNLNSEFALVLQSDIVKINFDFNPAQKEIYSINLNKLALVRFKALGFSVRKSNYRDNVILKVEFTNAFKEKSDIYINDIPVHKWKDYKIGLAEFKAISDWSEMSGLAFIIEEWNAKDKKGGVYIDNVRFLR